MVGSAGVFVFENLDDKTIEVSLVSIGLSNATGRELHSLNSQTKCNTMLG